MEWLENKRVVIHGLNESVNSGDAIKGVVTDVGEQGLRLDKEGGALVSFTYETLTGKQITELPRE